MGAIISQKIVVNLRTIDGSVKRRCEFRTSLSLTDVKHLMAERVYGPHARDLPPSRIRLAACAPPAGASRMSPQQAGSGATGSSGRRCVGGAGAGAGAGAGSAASAARGTATDGVAQSAVDDGFEIDSVSSITPELVITVSVLPVPETGAGTGRSRSLPEPPLSHRTAGTSHAEHGGVAAPATPTRAKAASVPGATPTTPIPVEAPRLGYADESERADAKATLVKRLPDSGGTPATGFYNLVMAGDSGVGKSSLLLRFTKDEFNPQFSTTIGIDLRVVNVQFDDVHVRMRLWDSSGQKSFNQITQSYLRNAHGVLAVFDVTSRGSFEQAKQWVEFVVDSESFVSGKSTVLLVGNKVDRDGRQVSQVEAHEWAVSRKLPYFETSAKDGVGISAPFHFLGMRMARAHPPLGSPALRKPRRGHRGHGDESKCAIL